MGMPCFHASLTSWFQPSTDTRIRGDKHSFVRTFASLAGKLVLPAIFVALAIMNVESLDRIPSVCLYRYLFGVRCPGCGMTHAFCCVLHGHFAQAFAYNPLVIIAFPFFGTMAIRNLRAFLNDLRSWAVTCRI